MDRRRLWRSVRSVFLAAILVSASIGVVTPLLDGATRVAEAGVAAGKKDDKDDKRKDKQRDDDRGDDFVLNGQVLEVHEEKEPPELVVGTVDGPAVVRILKTDEIARNGVRPGDHVELTGEKINEQLFEATEISVGERLAAPEPGADAKRREDDEGPEE